MIRSFDGRKPRIDATAFIHDSAEIIGAVTLAEGTSIWPMAVLRGDVNRIEIGAGTNVQDQTVIHCREAFPTLVGKGVTIGHGVLLHGARVGDGCLIGMGAIVMESVIGARSLIAAGAMVPKGLRIPKGSLLMGMPAKVVRKLRPEELRDLKRSELSYRKLAAKHRKTSKVLFG